MIYSAKFYLTFPILLYIPISIPPTSTTNSFYKTFTAKFSHFPFVEKASREFYFKATDKLFKAYRLIIKLLNIN